MRKQVAGAMAGLLWAAAWLGTGLRAQQAAAPAPLDDAEMDQLLAPIALYPDPLLAQVLPASTFVDQIDEAQRTLNGQVDEAVIEKANWDVSVKSVAHYPSVLQMMDSKRDWTTALGQAYVNQSTDVMKSVQRLRGEAKAAGTLVSNNEQTVEVQGESIAIVPAQPTVIYVPTYDPQVVYVGPTTGEVVAASAISFGAGLAIGAWLNNGCNWNSYTVYYHGWHGGGWVGASAGYVHVNNNVYVNNRYGNGQVNVNRNINNYNTNSYRAQLNRNVNAQRQGGTYNNSQNIRTQPANLDAAKGRAQSAQATRAAGGQAAQTPARSTAASGERSTTSSSAFSGYGSGAQTARNSARGQQSLSSARAARPAGRRPR